MDENMQLCEDSVIVIMSCCVMICDVWGNWCVVSGFWDPLWTVMELLI